MDPPRAKAVSRVGGYVYAYDGTQQLVMSGIVRRENMLIKTFQEPRHVLFHCCRYVRSLGIDLTTHSGAGCYFSLKDYERTQSLFDMIPSLLERKKVGGKDLPTEIFIKKKREPFDLHLYRPFHSQQIQWFSIRRSKSGGAGRKRSSWRLLRSVRRKVRSTVLSRHVF